MPNNTQISISTAALRLIKATVDEAASEGKQVDAVAIVWISTDLNPHIVGPSGPAIAFYEHLDPREKFVEIDGLKVVFALPSEVEDQVECAELDAVDGQLAFRRTPQR